MPSAQCTGAHGEAICGRNSPGNSAANTTANTPSNANARRTPGNGTHWLSMAYTASTSHSVADRAGANPKRAPEMPVPMPAMSTTMATACAAQPINRARRGQSPTASRKHTAAP